jgi:hypothetical protein
MLHPSLSESSSIEQLFGSRKVVFCFSNVKEAGFAIASEPAIGPTAARLVGYSLSHDRSTTSSHSLPKSNRVWRWRSAHGARLDRVERKRKDAIGTSAAAAARDREVTGSYRADA